MSFLVPRSIDSTPQPAASHVPLRARAFDVLRAIRLVAERSGMFPAFRVEGPCKFSGKLYRESLVSRANCVWKRYSMYNYYFLGCFQLLGLAVFENCSQKIVELILEFFIHSCDSFQYFWNVATSGRKNNFLFILEVFARNSWNVCRVV